MCINALPVSQTPGGRNNHAWQSAVTHQQVTADAVPEDGCIEIEIAQKRRQVINALRYEKDFGRATCTP
jgi:hypothetical protein